MFIRFDYRCSRCGHQEERFVRKSEMDDQLCRERITDPYLFGGTVSCSGHVTRLPAAPRTTFRFYDTKLKD